jgi:hypothetical protein
MRILFVTLLMTAMFAAGAGPTARAQLTFSFGPEPDFSRPQCTRDYLRSLQTQAEALDKLRTSGPQAIGRFCALIELGSAWVAGLPEDKRRELRGLLGVDVDIGRLGEQCRAGQDAIGRELTVMLRRVKSELVRCDDTI